VAGAVLARKTKGMCRTRERNTGEEKTSQTHSGIVTRQSRCQGRLLRKGDERGQCPRKKGSILSKLGKWVEKQGSEKE